MNSPRISLLPEEIGEEKIAENTMKVELIPTKSETERAILYVAPEGCVYDHSHEGSDSELYFIIELNEDGSDYTVTVDDVAGLNSPTGKLNHSIKTSDKPKTAIAIKRGQKPGLWNDYNNNKDGKDYLRKLGFNITVLSEELLIISSNHDLIPDGEQVIINLLKNQITYCSMFDKVFGTLSGLQSQTCPSSQISK